MKLNITLGICAIAIITTTLVCTAQTASPVGNFHCGTDEVLRKTIAEDHKKGAAMDEFQRVAIERDRVAAAQNYPKVRPTANDNQGSGNRVQSPPTFIIPVVFHILHEYGSENISDAQVLDAMRILNDDYRKLNADTSLIVSAFQGIADDCEIEFRLAALDPNGNCTNGIDRIQTFRTHNGDDSAKLNSWDRSRYLNIWVVEMLQNYLAGISTFPTSTTPASIDGILIRSDCVGSIGTSTPAISRTLTHEVGHFLGLSHVWGNTAVTTICGDDGVSDTPMTKGWMACTLTGTDVCNSNVEENVQNYMEYSHCGVMFTSGQRAWMWAVLTDTIAQRNSLWSPATHAATGILNPMPCSPIADFMSTSPRSICSGSSVSFSEQCFNGTPTSYNWTFNGGTPNTSTDSTPTITYSSPGLYDVKLTASNAQGSDSITKTTYVYVSPTQAQYSAWQYTEGFENTSTFIVDWDTVSVQGLGWANSTIAASTGSHCAMVDKSPLLSSAKVSLVSPSFDLTAMAAPVLRFNVAFNYAPSSYATDALRVYVSTDCGETWVQRYQKNTIQLLTAQQSGPFIPTASQWRTETVTFLPLQLSSSNVRIKFEFSSGQSGNDIFIDDINILGTNGIVDSTNGLSSFEIFPNPAQENCTIDLNLVKDDEVGIEIVDLNGNLVQNVYSGELSQGHHSIPVGTTNLVSGMYFVRVVNNEGYCFTKKLLIQ